MSLETIRNESAPSERGIFARFAHLLSAQVVEGVATTVFFLYMARIDSTLYGGVMYAMAAGSIVTKVIQFGLYYPMVTSLGEAGAEKAPEIINRVNVIKLGLLFPCMLAVIGIGFHRGFSPEMSQGLFLICLGFALEAVADTFFGDMRVKGEQGTESRIKILSSVAAYGFGFIGVFFGLHPVVISTFRLISGVIRIAGGLAFCARDYSSRLWQRPEWQTVRLMFKAATPFALIDILGTVYNKTNIFFLENSTGLDGVASYSATWNIVDAVSTLVSEQFLGWVIFPLLAAYWWKSRSRVQRLVRSNAQWLMALAFPIMFVLGAESHFLISFIYGGKYDDAIWMQQYLVWTIPLSFENNLFQYVMMVSGAVKLLLVLNVVVTVLNVLLNFALVGPYGLAGGCMVIILTKLAMTVFTYSYCRIRFGFFRTRDFFAPLVLAVGTFGLFLAVRSLLPLHGSVLITVVFYLLVLWRFGTAFLGPLPGRTAADRRR